MPIATIPDDLTEFIQSEIASGRYSDPDAVLVHALRLLQRDRAEAVEAIQRGLADAASGRVQSLTDAFDDLRREISTAAS